MRALLIVLAGLAAVVVAALAIGPRFVDWNRFRPELAALAERATGRRLAIDGDVAFSLLPTPTLSASGVRLGNRPGAAEPELMRLKSLDARIALGPLLAGRVVVESVVLVEPALVLDAGPAAAGGGDTTLDARLSFDRIIVVDGSLTWRGGAGTVRLERINAEITASTAAGPFRVGGDVAWQGLPWRFELGIGRLDAAAPISLSLGLRGGGATLRVSGTVTPGAGTTLMTGRLRADAAHLSELLAAIGPTGSLPTPLGDAATLEATLEIDRDRIALNDMALTLGDDVRANGALGVALDVASGPRAAFDLTLAVNRLDVERWSSALPPARAAPAPASRPELRGTIDLTVDAVLWRGAVVRQARLNGVLGDAGLTVRQAAAQLPGGSDVALFGQLSLGDAPRFDGHLEGGADNLRSLFDWLKLDVGAIPPDRLRRVSVTTGLSVASDKVELDNMDLRFDASRLTGSLVAALGARPAFGANLRLDRLNLEAYLPRAAAPSGDPLAWLDAFDANLQLQVDQLTYDTLPVQGVIAEASLERGTLRVTELSADSVAGARGSVSGVIRRAGGPAEAELTLSAQAADPSRLMQLLGDELATPALGPLAVSLSATGPIDHLRLVLQGELAGGLLGASGEADLPALGGSATVTVHHDEALRLLRAAFPGYRPAADAIGPLDLTGILALTPARLELANGALTLGPARLVGTAAIQLAGPRRGLTLTLEGPSLVLDPLLPRRLADRPPGLLGADLWTVIGATPAAFAGLALDLDAEIALGELDYRRFGATDVRLALGRHDAVPGRVQATARVWDGKLELSGTLETAREPALALKLALSDVAAGPAAEALLGTVGLDGRLDLAAELAASGTTERELVGSLTGGGQVHARAGAIAGFDLSTLDALLQARAPADDFARAVEQALSRGRTAFAGLDGGFALRGAGVTTDDTRLTSESGTAELRGAVDLAAERMDLGLRLQPAGDAAAPAARLRLVGPLSAPTRELDCRELIAYLAARRTGAPADGGRRAGSGGR